MSKEQEREAAAQRVRAYLAERSTVRGLHQEQIHGFHEGHEREASLLASDLAALASPAAEPVQALTVEQLEANGYVQIHIDQYDKLECYRRLLEIIALGDSADPRADARQELVAQGFWSDEAALASPPATGVPEGYALVPLTPTQAMCQAGQWKAQECPKFPLRIVPIYQAMLAAAADEGAA